MMSKFLLKNEFMRGNWQHLVFDEKRIGTTHHLSVCGYIIFGVTPEPLCEKSSPLIGNEYEKTMRGELNFFFVSGSSKLQVAPQFVRRSTERNC